MRMIDWSEHQNFLVSLRHICATYNQRHGTNLAPKQIAQPILHKLFQINAILDDQVNCQQESVKLLENQYRLYLSALIENMNRQRSSQDHLSLTTVDTNLGSELRDCYLMGEFLGFAIRDGEKIIQQAYPPHNAKPQLSLQKLFKRHN